MNLITKWNNNGNFKIESKRIENNHNIIVNNYLDVSGSPAESSRNTDR